MTTQNASAYCRSHTLIIPDCLSRISDIEHWYAYRGSAWFYKDLAQNLVDVEFYTQRPCVIYTMNGEEQITTADNQTYTLSAGSTTLLPQGVNLHSDFVRSTQSLQAYLLFFSDRVIDNFLTQAQLKPAVLQTPSAPLITPSRTTLYSYFRNLRQLCDGSLLSGPLFELKLQELLHLLLLHNAPEHLCALLQPSTPKPVRNLHRLMQTDGIHKLTVADLASLSGRSLSSFNRDFRNAFSVTPKQWLTARRMELAKELLQTRQATVTHVAAELGYENISHFIKLFRTTHQMTPKQFMNHSR